MLDELRAKTLLRHSEATQLPDRRSRPSWGQDMGGWTQTYNNVNGDITW